MTGCYEWQEWDSRTTAGDYAGATVGIPRSIRPATSMKVTSHKSMKAHVLTCDNIWLAS